MTLLRKLAKNLKNMSIIVLGLTTSALISGLTGGFLGSLLAPMIGTPISIAFSLISAVIVFGGLTFTMIKWTSEKGLFE